jgi:hypothetical protein
LSFLEEARLFGSLYPYGTPAGAHARGPEAVPPLVDLSFVCAVAQFRRLVNSVPSKSQAPQSQTFLIEGLQYIPTRLKKV